MIPESGTNPEGHQHGCQMARLSGEAGVLCWCRWGSELPLGLFSKARAEGNTGYSHHLGSWEAEADFTGRGKEKFGLLARKLWAPE